MPIGSLRTARLAVALAAAVAAGAGSASESRPSDQGIDPGREIYLHGALPSGGTLRALVQQDVPAAGAQLVCAGCHGRSGMGVGEGQTVIPAVAGAKLYRPREIRHRQLHASRTLRPAYTDATLAQAIRSGTDPTGRSLDAMMPRYQLDDADLAQLVAYLKSLSSQLSPGVSDTDIHFATVIAGADPRRRKAVLDVLEAFFASKAAETRQEPSRAGHSAIQMEWHYQAYRKWNLHVWDLTGPPETWRNQLEQFYGRQPVFAVIGGVGDSWQQIHEFCERQQLPCLLPNTDLPVVSDANYYSVYFSKGLVLEAQVLAKHLSSETAAPTVQVYRKQERAIAAASAFRQAMKQRGITDLQDRVIEDSSDLAAATRYSSPGQGSTPRYVLWMDEADLKGLGAGNGPGGPDRRTYLSSSLLGTSLQSAARMAGGEVYAVSLYDLPGDSARRLKVLDVWMRSRQIPLTDAPLQANTLFAATLAAQALKHIGSNFYRDYFIERIEHIFDSMVTPSAYPRLALGPNQRFASKGGYVLKVGHASGGITQASEWIVP